MTPCGANKKIKDGDWDKFNKSVEGWDYYQYVLLKVELKKEPLRLLIGSGDRGYFRIDSQSGFAGDHYKKDWSVDEDMDMKHSYNIEFEWKNSASQKSAWNKAFSIFKRLCNENDLIITEYDDCFCGLWKYIPR